MDRLQPNQQINVNGELVSNNGWFRLVMQGDGNLVIYRTMTGQALWASNTVGQPNNYAVMQGDGNFVVYTAQGAAQWASGTNGRPGAWVVMQDDGNLVVYDASNHPLWASNTAQNLLSPTVTYTDDRGYSYVETSETWKQLCSVLPCFAALTWPDYATQVRDVVIDGQQVVLQLWKGWCPKFLGLQSFPGGVGAEVGVYRRIPGRARPNLGSLPPGLPLQLVTPILNAISTLADDDLWWPFPELGARVEYTLINPVTNQTFYSAGTETTYWLAKWMNDGSYTQYQKDLGLKWPWLPTWWPGNASTPQFSADYILDFTINGQSYERWPAGPTAPRTTGRTRIGPTVRSQDKLDIFMTDASGVVQTAAWEPAFTDGWHGWWPIGDLRTPAGAPVHAVSRSTDKLDIFATDVSGAIQTAAWEPAFTDGWHGWWAILGGRAAPGAAVTAVSRNTDKLDIFVVGTDGRIYTAAWEPDFTDGWHGWWAIGDIRAPAGAPVHAVSRAPDKLDIFVTDANGFIQTAAWEPAFTDGWHGWWEVQSGRAAPGSPVTAVSRSQDKLDIFVAGTDGRLYTAAWEPAFTDGWHGWWAIGNIFAPQGSQVDAVSRSTDHLDVFVTDVAGVIQTAAWEPAFTDGWHGWWNVAGGYSTPGAPVTATSRNTDKLDAFVVGTDGRVYAAAWEPAFTGGWHGWWPIG
jgi:hypothetical protein